MFILSYDHEWHLTIYMPIILSVLVGSHSSLFGKKTSEDSDDEEEDDTANVDGATVFNSSWIPGSDSKYERTTLTCLPPSFPPLSHSLSQLCFAGLSDQKKGKRRTRRRRRFRKRPSQMMLWRTLSLVQMKMDQTTLLLRKKMTKQNWCSQKCSTRSDLRLTCHLQVMNIKQNQRRTRSGSNLQCRQKGIIVFGKNPSRGRKPTDMADEKQDD